MEAIKTFDPSTQLSNAGFDFVTIIPNINSSLFTENKALLLNYFDPLNTILVMDDAEYAFDIFDKKMASAVKAYETCRGEIKQVPPVKLFASSAELKVEYAKYTSIEYGIKPFLAKIRLCLTSVLNRASIKISNY